MVLENMLTTCISNPIELVNKAEDNCRKSYLSPQTMPFISPPIPSEIIIKLKDRVDGLLSVKQWRFVWVRCQTSGSSFLTLDDMVEGWIFRKLNYYLPFLLHAEIGNKSTVGCWQFISKHVNGITLYTTTFNIVWSGRVMFAAI